jgi:antimicrobial peptide system SdpB family protein
VLLFSPDAVLFAYLPDLPSGIRCSGVRSTSLWCIVGSGTHAMLTGRLLAIAVLVAVASGYRPRWTCVPHWYVTFSMASSMTLPNGGDQVAQIVCMLLIPVCLGDRRTWQWRPSAVPLPPTWRGASYAALMTVRAQTSIIYGTAAVSKLRFRRWRDGTALYSIAFDPSYGMPLALRRLVQPAFRSYPLLATMTWAAVAAELAIAALVLCGWRVRRWASALAVPLHIGIAVTMGLVSFGVVMIALVAIAYTGKPPARELRDRRSGERQPDVLEQAGSRMGRSAEDDR